MNRRIFWRRKGCCLDIFVMTQMDLPGKQALAEHCSIRLAYMLLLQIYLYITSLDHSDTNGNSAKYNYAALTSHDQESDAETDKLFTLAFLLARGKNAKMSGQTLGP